MSATVLLQMVHPRGATVELIGHDVAGVTDVVRLEYFVRGWHGAERDADLGVVLREGSELDDLVAAMRAEFTSRGFEG